MTKPTIFLLITTLLTPVPGYSEQNLDENQWRSQVKETKRSRNAFVTLGTIGAVGGAALFISGVNKHQSAEDVPGCRRDGSNILCNSPQGADEANDRLDEGEGLIYLGTAVVIVGGGLLLGGIVKTRKIRQLEEDGRKNGFTLGLNPLDGEEVRLAYNFYF